jgi:hypothetical protein
MSLPIEIRPWLKELLDECLAAKLKQIWNRVVKERLGERRLRRRLSVGLPVGSLAVGVLLSRASGHPVRPPTKQTKVYSRRQEVRKNRQEQQNN